MPENTQTITEVSISDGSNNRIDDVVVFTRQAYIKRHVKAQMTAGLNRFLIEVKAFSLDNDSIQAKVFSDCEILTVQSRKIPVTESIQSDVKALEKELRELEQQRKVLLRQIETLDKQSQFLDTTLAYANVEIPKELKTDFPTPQKLKEMLSFLDQNYSQLNAQKNERDQQLQQLDDQLGVARRKLKQVKKPAHNSRQVIEILLSASSADALEMDVYYIAQQAYWSPVYKVDVSADLNSIQLTSFAQISQNTGEHWDNVTLSVSNAVPLKGSRLPDQNSWYLHLSSSEATIQPVYAAAPPEAGAVAEEYLDDIVEEAFDIEPEAAVAASYAQSTTREMPLAFEYQLPMPASIDHGEAETLLPLKTEPLEGKFYYFSIPKQDPLVYLVCDASLQTTYIPGKLNIYLAGRFIATSYLDEKRAGQSLLINLGADREVKINRERIVDKITESFFGVVDRNSVVREFEYQIIIENLKKESILVQIVDAAPVTTTDKIQIKDLTFKPEPDIKEWQDRKGIMLWNLTIKEKSEQKLQTSFYVKYPKDDPPYEL
jgi:uncharacterized protein (TIGR02231 family)